MDSTQRIAICFYGQPRLIEKGYNNISKFILEISKTHKVDIFIHTWWDRSLIGHQYQCSPWRNVSADDLTIRENTIDLIKDLYNSTKMLVEEPRTFSDEIFKIQQLNIYKNSPSHIQNNINNILSNLYSKSKVADLLSEYCAVTGNTYNGIVSLRFDMLKPIPFNFMSSQENKIYTLPVQGRFYLSDNILVFTSIDIFYNYSKAYVNIGLINDSDICREAARSFGLNVIINVEEIVTLNLLLYYSKEYLTNIVQFCNDIPNFI